MMPPYSWAVPRHEAGHVYEGHDRDIEAVAEAHEAPRFHRRGDVEAARQHVGLVGDDADGPTLHAGESHHDVLGVFGLDLEKVGIVHDLQHQLFDVVALVGVGRHQGIQRSFLAVGSVRRGPQRQRRAVVGRQVVHQLPDHEQRLNVVLERAVRNARTRRVGDGAAELLVGDVLLGDRSDHLRPGHVHIRRVFHHEDEIGHGRRVNRSARARAHDHRNLRE